ncbi:MAG TPA: ArsA-related P-loop ATPase [Nakamurella sp.]|nr:ArsA-related P-loop ATPase [Nakamurella sp.]
MSRRVLDLGPILRDGKTRVVVTCGSGGVGKTTTAAAMALWAADAGRKVAVLTIDPAKRLAQSLGLEALDNDPRRVDVELADPKGELWAMMLDTARTFDEMVGAHSTPERAKAILANPFYKVISTSFSGTQEYMAMEKLSTLAATNQFDLIVVDTPPSRSALDFLDAPQRLSSFLDGRMIRLLSAPTRGVMKIVGAGFTLFTKAVTTVLGGQMLHDAAQFVQLFEDMFGGFRERAQHTYELLRAPGTAFVVVSICEADSLREASYFADRLRAERMPLAGLILNRTHPPLAKLPLPAAEVAQEKIERSAPLAAAVLGIHSDRLEVRAAELHMRARFDRVHTDLPVVEVASLASDAHDLPALREIGRRLTAA